uniref:Fatty-acid amide hydrolase 1 n=1 Tax=Cyclopterus lumpus TaxID=8103 RepID=A0A8C2WJE2_CYCLU
MDNVNQFLQGARLDGRTAALLTGAACGAGALLALVHQVYRHQVAKEKMQRARNRRADGLQRAEEAVLQYKKSRPGTDPALILAMSLSELTNSLQEGLLSPEDVFYSYMEKTLDVNKDLNCCTGILLESFDQLTSVASNKEGLLYGVPVSIKENYSYKNHDCSCGVVVNLEQPAEKDSVIVEVLKRQGAIPFVKTNLPQALLNYDCSNPIYGQSLNPHNLQKTPGGSSGGEGALVGGGGSLLGFGSDVGGSIRIPCSFCGICGLKPTPGRLSSLGIQPIYRGQKSVPSCPGPMARDVDSLALAMQALLCDHMFSLDPTVPPIPFNKQIYQSSKPLRIGYLESDGYTQPSPSMTRVTFFPLCPLCLGILADGGTISACLCQLPFHLWSRVRKLFGPSGFVAHALSVQNLWKQHAAVEDYIHETVSEWRRLNIDVLLCPMIGPAFNFDYCGRITSVLSYTILYNLLTFPAGVVPVSTVTAEDEEELRHYEGIFKDHWDKLFKQAVTGGEGLPVAVQCIALPWQDELCLRFMKEVEQLVKQSRK